MEDNTVSSKPGLDPSGEDFLQWHVKCMVYTILTAQPDLRIPPRATWRFQYENT
jgi:hypothetical protein